MAGDAAARTTRRRTVAAGVLAAALVAGCVAIAVIAARGPSGPVTLQQRVRAVAVGLRCPVCQDLSVADSPSPLARAMRARIGSELSAGASPAAIRDDFVRAYGAWILMSPPRRGLSLVVWILPLVLAIVGCAIAVVAVRRWTRDLPSAPPEAVRDADNADDAGGETSAAGAPRTAEELSASDRRLLERALTTATGSEEPA